MYHLSSNPDLKQLTPRKPYSNYDVSLDDNVDDTEVDSEEHIFSEPSFPRISLAPSPELCFRAIYPNISNLLEDSDEPEITFTLYRASKYNPKKLHTPRELIENRWVHDAHVTLEHFSTDDVTLEKVGLVTFKNTSDDVGLYYRAYVDGKVFYHSPLNIIKL